MRKLANIHYNNIIAITLATMQDYTKFALSCAEDEDDSNVMHMEDILYMQTALNEFIADRDVAKLQDKIMMQDTFVREYYISTLRYMEDEMLVPYYYCC